MEIIMKFNRKIALALAIAVLACGFASCKAEDGKISESNTETESASLSESVTDSESVGTDDTDVSDSDNLSKDDAELDKIFTAVKESFGDDWMPNMALSDNELDSIYGIKSEWMDAYKGEIPMISFHVDTFIGVRAADGHADDVEKALNDYYTFENETALQYPANEIKVKAARVYRNGDYVFFIMLGSPADDFTDETAEREFYDKANEGVISIIDEILGSDKA